ncbi:hypothetical protein D8674_034407 [Pyrus ussuriensis x Pyrus communis]|uniref:Uncharacterized protein n=1 Tax=Pyrus ussuriensis x Pyrus communis TaxID=2448454 RepID=A0A5N5HTY4_9ROSA|nr:hypothetical protein D8674_034407 [Pyrus ussuriensis x Pyrus communis]
MPVIFDLKQQVPIDAGVSAFFTSKIGILVRSDAPVSYKRWMKILAYVNKKMGKLSSKFRFRLHEHYLSCETPARGRTKLPDKSLWNERPVSHWHWLCDNIYTSEVFLKQKYHHKGGARPFIQHARNAHKDKMRKQKDEVMEKLIQEAPNGTPANSLQVPLDDEFGINLGRKGKSINGVGIFPRMHTSDYVSSMPSSSELTEMKDQIKLLSTSFVNLEKENKELKKKNDVLILQVKAL